ncbi:HAD-IB family phosphatase [Sphingomonas sp. NBWT7]|uniref:HAD family hydrolase n=1 Tax=Sphingomonas sp. NBWT7 TaxID=2596913 RepID=UPI001627F6F2|nr:HAD-IB family phosphatase [Sphingomonas sp. NBWT7]QNE32208.1 HAD-IB family phosphatase [Sphingomonas sp. NBWT7]
MSAAAPVRLAIYDLDRTITALPTWTPFLLFAAWRSARWRLALLPAVSVAALLRALGAIDRDRLKEAMHRLLLGSSLSPRDAEALADAFAAWLIPRHVRPGALAQLAADRAEGQRIVIATAAHRFYAAAIARRLGVSDLVATEARRDDSGNIQPWLAGPNCYGPAKQAMLAAWLDRNGFERQTTHIRFYSDHVIDAATFDWIDEAVAVNPHPALRTLAHARGWQISDWR